jgi:putative FmdB family regulatory protein
MPIYEYRCSSCGFQKEYLRKLSDPVLTVCPECGKQTFCKMLSAAGFQLKGSGWYATDFKGSGAKPVAKSDKADKAAKTDKADAKQDKPAAAEKPAASSGKEASKSAPAAADAPAARAADASTN